MLIPKGQFHKDEPAEFVLISDPWFVKLTLEYKCPDGNIPKLEKEFRRLISIFDNKKFLCQCQNCSSQARAITFLKETFCWRPWCTSCTAPWLEKNAWKYHMVTDYRSALYFIERYGDDDKDLYEKIIGAIAELKGLPLKPSPGEAIAFFCTQQEDLPFMLDWDWEKPPRQPKKRPKKSPEPASSPESSSPESSSPESSSPESTSPESTSPESTSPESSSPESSSPESSSLIP